MQKTPHRVGGYTESITYSNKGKKHEFDYVQEDYYLHRAHYVIFNVRILYLTN